MRPNVQTTPLSNLEVNQLAAGLASNVVDHLNQRWYDNSNISLSIAWSTKPGISAFASVWPVSGPPTRHVITLTYDLVSRIYSEALDFAFFANGRKGEMHPTGAYLIADRFDILQSAEFMFESGITFVIFHELGHINQGHGLIRAKYAAGETDTSTISEFAEMSGSMRYTGSLASVCHATEFAADYEALDWMFLGLGSMFKGDALVDHAYLQCAIVSCIMLMFNGARPFEIDTTPEGSHPYPLPRMDFWVRAYAERIALIAEQIEVKLDNNGVVQRFADASFWAILKWMTRLELPDTPDYTNFVKGARAHPNYATYMQTVINMWSQEYQSARKYRMYGSPFAVLYFTDEYRNTVGATLNIETLTQHLQNAMAPTIGKARNGAE